MTTELDDLKSAWQTLSRNLDRQHSLALHQFREGKSARLRSGFRLFVCGQVLQIFLGLAFAILGGKFWTSHLDAAHLVGYGVTVHAYGVMMIIFAARELSVIGQLDYAAPVLAIQKQIAQLRRWHVRSAFWFGITGCFIWIPLLLMAAYASGLDVWTHRPSVVGSFLLSGLVAAALLTGFVLWIRRPGKETLARKVADDSAGRSIRRAEAMLEEIERFERE